MQNLTPSRKPGQDADQFDLLNLHFRKSMLDVDDMMPARIVSVDMGSNRAQLEILYLVTLTSSQVVPMVAPAEIPIRLEGGGGIVLLFPWKPGDLGWIKSNDRDLSLFLQEYNAQPGNTPRIHSFEDAIFIPDVMRGYDVVEPGAASLQTLDGSTRVTLKGGEVKVVVGSCSFTITDAGVVCNKPIQAPQFTDGTLNTIGHVHTNPEGGNVGPMKNP